MAHWACMIDLETFGLGLNPVIISMSAQVCDLEDERGFIVEAAFNRKFQIPGQGNRVMDPSTVLWWMAQSDEAKQEILSSDRVPFQWCMKDFWTWYKVEAPKIIHSPIHSVWSKGVDFDVAIIDAYYKGSNSDTPWHYRERMCYRTVAALYPGIKFVEPQVKHSAIQDCTAQLEHLKRIWFETHMSTRPPEAA